MKFLNTIKSSVYDPEFYSKVVRGEDGGPFRYFFKLILSISLIFTLVASFTVVPHIKEFFEMAESNIVEHYPKELEVRIQKGLVSTNVEEPYFIPIPENVRGKEVNERGLLNLVVIDTKNQFSLEQFDSYNTFALLIKDGLVTKDQRGKVTIMPLKDVPDYTLNYSEVTKWLTKAEPFLRVFSIGVPILIFIAVFIAYSMTLVYLVFAAVLVYIVGKIKKLNLSYRKSYHISLYAVTLPILLGILSFLVGLQSFAFLPTIILVIAVWVNLKEVSVDSSPEAGTSAL